MTGIKEPFDKNEFLCKFSWHDSAQIKAHIAVMRDYYIRVKLSVENVNLRLSMGKYRKNIQDCCSKYSLRLVKILGLMVIYFMKAVMWTLIIMACVECF